MSDGDGNYVQPPPQNVSRTQEEEIRADQAKWRLDTGKAVKVHAPQGNIDVLIQRLMDAANGLTKVEQAYREWQNDQEEEDDASE